MGCTNERVFKFLHVPIILAPKFLRCGSGRVNTDTDGWILGLRASNSLSTVHAIHVRLAYKCRDGVVYIKITFVLKLSMKYQVFVLIVFTTPLF